MKVTAIFLITLLFINQNAVVYSNIPKCKKSSLRYTFVLIPAADDFKTIMKIVGKSRSAIVNRSWKDKDIVEITVDSTDFDQIYQTSKSLKVYSYHSTFCIPSTTKSPIPSSTTTKKVTLKTVIHKTTISSKATTKSTASKNATQKFVTSKSVTQKTTPSKSVTQKNTPSKSVTPKITPSKGLSQKVTPSKGLTQKVTPLKVVTQKTTPLKSVTQENAPTKQVTKKIEISKSVTQKIPQKNSKRSVNDKYKNRRKRSLYYTQYQNFPELWLDLKNTICSISRKCKYCRNHSYLITRLPVKGNQNDRITTTESVTLTPINQIVTYRPTLPISHRNWNIHKFFTPKTIESSVNPVKDVSKLKIIKNNDCEKMIDCDADQNEVELVYQQWD